MMGTMFGVLWGVVMWLWQWQELGLVGSLVVGVPSAVLAGLLYGLIMALFFRRRAAQFGLPSSWEEYPQA